MPRLEKLHIDSSSDSQQENFEKLLSSIPLSSLAYHRRSNPTSVESFLLQLLDSNSNLKWLDLHVTTNLVVTNCLFEKLMSSNLKTWHLQVDKKITVQDINFVVSYLSAARRKTAPCVTIRQPNYQFYYDYSDEEMASLLQCFPNLHHMEIPYRVSSNILLSLFKYQVKIIFLFHFTISLLNDRNLLSEEI